MKRFYKVSLVICVLFFTPSCAMGPRHNARVFSSPEGRFMELPGKLTIETALDKRLASTTTQVGEGFTVHTTEPVVVDTQVVIPEGTRIHGTVTKLTPPRFGLMKAKISFEFDGMEIGNKRIPIKGAATQSMTALAQKGAQAAGGYVAKEALKRAIPGLGTVLMIMDAKKAHDTISEDKEISLEPGTPILVKISKPFSVPLSKGSRSL